MSTVRTTQAHTGHGQSHEVGDVYQVDTFEEVENLRVLKFAALIDDPPAPEPASGTPVPVVTTSDVE